MPNRPRKNAYNLLRKRKQYKKLSLDDLHKIIEDKGFKKIEYRKYNCSEELKFLISKLDIEKEIQEKDSFFYYRNNLKFIFLNEDISDEDKHILLSHEIAHIYDERIEDSKIVYSNSKMENYANEFSHYFNNPSIFLKLYNFFISKPLLCILSLIFAFVASTGIISISNSHTLNDEYITTVNLNNLSSNMYYVTSTGKKYHKSFCKHVKYKTNIREYTFNQATLEGYLPCLDCIGAEL